MNIKKKSLIIGIIVMSLLLSNCSTEDENGLLSPPEWLIGTWITEDKDISGYLKLVVTFDDVIVTYHTGETVSHSNLIKEKGPYSETLGTIEESSSEHYFYVVDIQDYTLRKISENKISDDFGGIYFKQ